MNEEPKIPQSSVLWRFLERIGQEAGSPDPDVDDFRASLRKHLLSTEEGREWQQKAFATEKDASKIRDAAEDDQGQAWLVPVPGMLSRCSDADPTPRTEVDSTRSSECASVALPQDMQEFFDSEDTLTLSVVHEDAVASLHCYLPRVVDAYLAEGQFSLTIIRRGSDRQIRIEGALTPGSSRYVGDVTGYSADEIWELILDWSPPPEAGGGSSISTTSPP